MPGRVLFNKIKTFLFYYTGNKAIYESANEDTDFTTRAEQLFQIPPPPVTPAEQEEQPRINLVPNMTLASIPGTKEKELRRAVSQIINPGVLMVANFCKIKPKNQSFEYAA